MCVHVCVAVIVCACVFDLVAHVIVYMCVHVCVAVIVCGCVCVAVCLILWLMWLCTDFTQQHNLPVRDDLTVVLYRSCMGVRRGQKR
jgi:hypothetical protein